MYTKKRAIIATLLVALGMFFVTDTVTFAQALKIVPDCKGETCTFAHLFQLGNNIIDFMLRLMVPLAAVGFAIAGFFILFSGGDTGKVSKGKEIMWTVLYGMLFMLLAYAIIKTLLTVFE